MPASGGGDAFTLPNTQVNGMLTAPVGLRAAVLVAFLLAATVWSAPAVGQVLCGPRDGLDDLLKQRFGETRQTVGVSADARRIVELFVAPDGSWTIVVTDAHGRSCIVLSGEDWTQTPQMDGNALRSPTEPHTGISSGWASRAPVGDAGPCVRYESFEPNAASMLAETSAVACLMGSVARWA